MDVDFLLVESGDDNVHLGIGFSASIPTDTPGKIQIPSYISDTHSHRYQVTGISDNAFAGCSQLTSIQIPSTVDYIGRAFIDCNHVTSLIMDSRSPSTINIAQDAFEGLPDNVTLYVPAGTKSLYEAMSTWGKFAEIVESGPLSVGDISIVKNSIANLPVYLNNNEAVTGLQFKLTLPDGISITEEEGVMRSALTNRTTHMNVVGRKDPDSGNSFLFIMYPSEKKNITGTDGAILNIELKTNPSISAGSYSTVIDDIYMATPSYSTLHPAGSASELRVWNSEPVMITAKDYTIEYGEELPDFGYTVEGATLMGEPALTCEAVTSYAAGTYDIIVSKGTLSNDNVTYVNGTLTINKKTIGLAWGEETVFDYDGEEKVVAVTPTGIVGEDECLLTIEGKGTEIGTYTATVTAVSNDNYQLPEEGTTCDFEIVRKMEGLFRDANAWTTYVPQEDLSVPDGLTAYVVTSLGEATAIASSVTYMPQGAPLLLKREDKTANLFRASAGQGPTPATNLLITYDTNKKVSDYEGYILFDDEFVLVKAGTLPAGRVFLPANGTGSSMTRSIVIGDMYATGIEDSMPQSDEPDSMWFDMQGRKLEGKPTKKGIYIQNGRKVVVKY